MLIRSEHLRIFKYPLVVVDIQELQMPYGAEVLTCQFQGGQLCLWASVNDTAPSVIRRFAVYGTGHPMFVGEQSYIATVQQAGGALIWHVYEVHS